MVLQLHVVGVCKIVYTKALLGFFDALRCEHGGSRLLVHDIISVKILVKLLVVMLCNYMLFKTLYKHIRHTVEVIRLTAHT